MKRAIGLAIGLLALASIASAQTVDSATRPMTADEACKLAYQALVGQNPSEATRFCQYS